MPPCWNLIFFDMDGILFCNVQYTVFFLDLEIMSTSDPIILVHMPCFMQDVINWSCFILFLCDWYFIRILHTAQELCHTCVLIFEDFKNRSGRTLLKFGFQILFIHGYKISSEFFISSFWSFYCKWLRGGVFRSQWSMTSLMTWA